MKRALRWGALALVSAAVGCSDRPPTEPDQPTFEIRDGAHNGGNQHFYFLPPVVPAPAYTGTFDAALSPEVKICVWTGSACGAEIAAFSMTTGTGSEIIRMEPGEQQYAVNWHTDRFNLDPTLTYRIRVFVGSAVLGYADVDVVSTGRELRNVNTGEYIPLLDDRTLPIKFRIEVGALAPTWIQLSPTGTPPSGRMADHAGYDATNDRLIFFSGDAGSLPRPQDVWVLVNATGAGGTPSWVQLAPTGGPPFGRYGGNAEYDPRLNQLIVHGGCSANCGYAMSDTWILTNANGLGGAPTWTQRANAPTGRAEHSVTYDPGNHRMIVFGGQRAFPGTNLNDVWVYDALADTWQQLSPSGTPPAPRQNAQVVYDAASNRAILFGGLQSPDPFTRIVFNDVWVLTAANGLGGAPQWIQLAPADGPPATRGAHSQVFSPATNRMMIFGGADFTNFFDEVWVLTDANGAGGAPRWIQLAPSGGPPIGRALHAAGYSEGSNRMVVAMGRNDNVSPFLFNDVWVLTGADGIP